MEAHDIATNGERQLVLLDGEDSPEALNMIRECFAGFARVSPSLVPLSEPPEDFVPSRPRMPVNIPGECLHDEHQTRGARAHRGACERDQGIHQETNGRLRGRT